MLSMPLLLCHRYEAHKCRSLLPISTRSPRRRPLVSIVHFTLPCASLTQQS